MKKFICSTISTLALLTMSAFSMAGQIKFDEGITPQAGSISYDGVGGSLIGTGINFTSSLGVATLLEDGTSLTCSGCLLDFATGSNISEGPALWQWNAGGSLTLTGTLFQGITQIATGNLLTGIFTAPPSPTFAGAGSSGLFLSVGDITANSDIATFYGFSPTETFDFAHTVLAIGGCNFGVSGAFDCSLANADLNLVNAPVPTPATMPLFGLGLASLLFATKKKGKKKGKPC